MTSINNRYEIVYLFDVKNGNPNGDPDAGNAPRQDIDSGRGIITDVCLKRKVRNYVQMAKDGTEGYNIYVKEKAVLNNLNKEAYDCLNIKQESKKLPKNPADASSVTKWMCDKYFDIRAFGAVMTTEVNCGQVRGPIQMSFAESIDPIVPNEITITRCAVTKGDEDKERTMGNKYIVPYALYRAHIYVSAKLAEKTGFTADDFELFKSALINMMDHDRSAARGEMTPRKIVIFKHSDPLGNMPAAKLFERVKIARVNGEIGSPAEAFSDYEVTVDKEGLTSVEVIDLL